MAAFVVFVSIFVASFVSIGSFAKVFDVVQYGAIGDGKTDDTKAFLQAWNAFCSATDDQYPTLNIPESKTFLLGPLNFQGPCKSPIANVQVLGNIVAPTNVDAWKGCVKQSWIVFSAVNGLNLSGSGQIDGQGSLWWTKKYDTPTCSRPSALHFWKCRNMIISGLHHINPPKHHITIDECNNVSIFNLNISAPQDSPNTDGIDISASTHFLIHDLNIQTGDDCIAINNGSSYINITRVACSLGHGISVGSLGEGGSFAAVEEIYVRNCSFTKTKNGCRIKTWPGGTGYARKITFEQITLNDVQNPIIIDQHYCDYNGVPLQFCPEKPKAVQIGNVIYKDVEGTSKTEIGIKLDCSSNYGCENIIMEKVKITGNGVIASCENANGTAFDTSPKVPCLSA